MKICAPLLLLTILCPGGNPVFDFDLKTVETPSSNDAQQQDVEENIPYGNAERVEPEPEPEPDTELAYRGDENRCAKPKADCEKPPAPEGSFMEIENFVGTNLFDGDRKKCFSIEDVALMAARRDFEFLIPKDLPQCLLTDEMVGVIMHYFHSANQIIQRMPDDISKQLTEKAFYDMLGGYLKFYIVPVTKYSYYAGKACIQTVEKVLALFQQCKFFLNTNGNGWRSPLNNVLMELRNIKIEPLVVEANDEECDQPSSCMNLDMSSNNNDAEDDQMIISLPKLEPEDVDGFLGNIWLPFKRKRTFNLRSPNAASVVVKFYETVTRCYRFQSLCQDTYNHKFKAWILENIQVHLADEQFYPGLGAILRIYENLQRGKKAIVFEEKQEEDEDASTDDADADDETTDDEPEDDEVILQKRHKTGEFMEIENRSKQMVGQREDWLDRFDYDSGKNRKDTVPATKPKCKPKPRPEQNATVEVAPPMTTKRPKEKAKPKTKAKSKSKSKSKTKSKSKSKTKTKTKKPKAKAKAKNKTKSRTKTKSKNKTKSRLKSKFTMPSFNFSTLIPKQYAEHSCYLLALILFIILCCLLCAILVKKKRHEKSCAGQPPKKPGAKKRRCRSLCEMFRKKKKKPADEEVLIKPETTSVLPPPKSSSGTSHPGTRPSTSSSSVTCKPKAKWLPYTKRPKSPSKRKSKSPSKKDSDKSSAPIIETTSLDYSSSEPEDKKRKSSMKKASKPQKAVKIDERGPNCPPCPSPRKKCFLKKKSTPSNSGDEGATSPNQSPKKKSKSRKSTPPSTPSDKDDAHSPRPSDSPKGKKSKKLSLRGSKTDVKK